MGAKAYGHGGGGGRPLLYIINGGVSPCGAVEEEVVMVALADDK
jgi:hypothetical protein